MAITAGKAIDADYLLKQLKAFESQVIAIKYNVKFQYTTMPAPSVDYLGQFAQYVGVTTPEYTEGYFYKCVLDSTTYKWENVYQSSPEYTIKKDTAPSSADYVATYHITKDGVAIGDAIDIPKDFFLSDAQFGIATDVDIAPGGKLEGKGFVKGDTYLELDVNAAGGTSTTIKKIFCNMNGLVDVYTPGNGIDITNHKVSVKVDPNGPIIASTTGVNITLNEELKITADKKLALNFETTDIDFSKDW